MMTEVCICAPAKINMSLRVLPGAQGGFHAVESIMQTVTLVDELHVCLTKTDGECLVLCNETLSENNTIMSSYKAFCAVVGKNVPGVRVHLTKRIPSGGGLGGGSSDAVAFVKALELLSGITLSTHQKKEIAAQIGCDVFFFLFCGAEGCAVVTGRGEIVKPIQARRDLHVLLVFPEVKSSTKEAYVLVDEYFNSGKTVVCPAPTELETVYNAPVSDWNFANSFTPSLVNRFAEIGSALSDVRSAGALFAEMSGSGSTVYGIFPSEKEAENALYELAQRWKGCVVRPFCCK